MTSTSDSLCRLVWVCSPPVVVLSQDCLFSLFLALFKTSFVYIDAPPRGPWHALHYTSFAPSFTTLCALGELKRFYLTFTTLFL